MASKSETATINQLGLTTTFVVRALTLFAAILFFAGCGEEEEAPVAAPPPSTPVSVPKYLYVTSGACYSGSGNTTFTNATSSNLVYRLSMSTGAKNMTIADYFASPSNTGDSPVSVVSENGNSLLVLVENTTTVSLRRIERIAKQSYGARSTYSGNTTALSAQVRGMSLLPDGYLLVSKSTALEKMKDGTNRLLAGANPWVSLSAPASSCTTSATLLTAMERLNNGMLVFAHAGVGTARIGVVSPLGYSVAGDCKAAQAAPVATAFPTAMFYDKTNLKLIVAYAGNSTATDINSIYSYDMNETTGAISNPQKIYDASLFGSTYNHLLYGISAMTYDVASSTVYISTAVSTSTTVSNYRIEKFNYIPSKIGVDNPNVLVKSGTFYDFGSDTKCISSMTIAD